MVRRERRGKDVDACTASKYEQLLMHGFLCDGFFKTAQLLGSGFDGCGLGFRGCYYVIYRREWDMVERGGKKREELRMLD
jgi:hypothetical protein